MRAIGWLILATLLASAQAVRAQSQPVSAEQIDAAVARAVAHIRAARTPEGGWPEDVPDAQGQEFGGRTALALYALLTAGESYQQPWMQQSIQSLRQQEPATVLGRALRVMALTQLPPQLAQPTVAEDANWLIRASRDDGAYDYRPGNHGPDAWDNANTQMALLAVYSAARAGIETPTAYYRRLERHWLAHQTGEGGWSYNRATNRAYGSMSAAGLSSLLICREMIGDEAILTCRAAGDDEPIRRAMAYLVENYTPYDNPGRGPIDYFQWVYNVGRVGMTSGYKYIGDRDWFAECATELLRTQRPDGGWGRLDNTCYATLFLARGSQPLLLSKLQYEGTWNPRPRDATNLTTWLSRRFERPMRWQVLSADAPAEQWFDAPVLYISGATPPRFSDEQIERIRRFVYAGGMILSEAACNSATFNAEMRKIYQRLFPEYELLRIDPNHPIYTLDYAPEHPPVLMGVSNGLRLWAVHSPSDLSRAWHTGSVRTERALFDQAANLYYYVTETGQLSPAGLARPVEPDGRLCSRSVRLARLRHDGAWNPEPLTDAQLAARLANQADLNVVLLGPTDPAEVSFEHADAAIITGLDSLSLTDEQRAALRRFVEAGGTILVDAAGGSQSFTDSVRDELLTLPGERTARPVDPDAPALLHRPGRRIDRVQYRPATAAGMVRRNEPMLEAAYDRNGDPAVIFSRYDWTAGLAGVEGYHIRGLTPDSSIELVGNLLLYAAERAAEHRESSVDVEWTAP